MQKIRNIVAASALTIAMGVTSLTVFAAAKYDSPQEALAEITGMTVEEITKERFDEDKTYGEIAAETGKLDEFKVELFQQKKEIIEKRVSEGSLRRKNADGILERIEDNQATCSGDGERGRGLMGGFGFRFGNGFGGGRGNGSGRNR